MEMGSECSVLFLTGHTVVFGRETNVWLSVKECHLSAPALGDKSVLCAGLSGSQEHTDGESFPAGKVIPVSHESLP